MINIFVIGDIVGRSGRDAVEKYLPDIIAENNLQFVIASVGKIDEYWGINVTSSNVNESFILPIFNYI